MSFFVEKPYTYDACLHIEICQNYWNHCEILLIHFLSRFMYTYTTTIYAKLLHWE